MERKAGDGTDGSSIRPVSSLLAKFENMTKPSESPAAPPSRTRSPSPAAPLPAPATPNADKPRPRDATPQGQAREPPSIPKNRPISRSRDRLNGGGSQPSVGAENIMRSPNRPLLPPTGTSNMSDPPSLRIQPPQSPPKGNSDIAVGERPHFLSTDSLVKQLGPSPSPPSVASRPFRMQSRPHTPTAETRKSPRLSPSQPPSPPPPRRSGELRRERDAKPVPPPVNRSEKPAVPSRATYMAENGHGVDSRGRRPEKVSPFNSPPGSRGSSGDDEHAPPMLPVRPRPLPQTQLTFAQAQPPKQLARSKTIHVSYDPPPLHHSVASRRSERDDMAPRVQGAIPSPVTGGGFRPALPARPQNGTEQPRGRNGVMSMLPPPRPPRPIIRTGSQDDNSPIPQKRVASTPTTTTPPPQPVGKTHARSMTVDRTSSRTPTEFRVPHALIESTATPHHSSESLIGAPSKLQANGVQNITTTYPDTSSTNRRPPYIKSGVHEIHTKYDARIMDACGERFCTGGGLVRVWNQMDGELLMSLAMGEGIKSSAVAFKPGLNVDEEGQRVWIGTNMGEIMEADVATQTLVGNKASVHGRHEVLKIFRHFNELWSLDEGGTLHVWGPDSTGVLNLSNNPNQTFRVPRGHTFSMVVGDELWYVTGKDIRVYRPTLGGESQFQVLIRPLGQESIGEITSGTILTSDPDKVFFGHNDGKISIYSRKNYTCVEVLSISSYKINSLAGVGDYIWAGYNTGRICVYDLSQTPWAVKKDWQAHDNPIVKILPDRASFYKLNRYQVVSLGADNMVRAWDGLLQEDWLEAEMRVRDVDYCHFEKLRVLCMTWNAGASTPNSLRYSESDATFFRDLLQRAGSPDILIFGFQELVDLEDKTATAKRFLKTKKKKEGSDQERMSHQYRDWRDFLVRCLDDYMSGDLYHLLHTAPLVGLFTCIFVKADLRDRVSNLSAAEVKRGMGGLHGNKGAIVVRFMIDDTSMCFVNCHLAAGQSQANSRHADIAAILESAILPVERDQSKRIDNYIGGGDGTMILDHELCLLNGDLNYRIDTMSRDTVVMAVKSNNLTKLLERDQLLVARRRNPAFKLRAFDELPITFAPTYKYDVGTDNYDTSEKKRSPAWCDRLLYRGRGRIEQVDYKRHEVRVSDHRPVSGRFWFTVKRVSPKRRAQTWMECQQRWEQLREREGVEEKLYYLTQVIGYDDEVARKLVKDRARKEYRSPSRNRG